MERTARVLITTLLVGGAVAGAALVRRSVVGSAPAVTSRTDYGRRNPRAKTETATFAAGCFWKLEHAMRGVDGVVATTAGYIGGDVSEGISADAFARPAGPAPTHAAVSAGRTGHAEAVCVEYDPAVVSYDALLAVFWKSHDPAQFIRDEPGEPPSAGRSAIFYHTDAQRAAALASKASLRASLPTSGKEAAAEIPTEILPAQGFFPAEAEQQQYLDRTRGSAACRLR